MKIARGKVIGGDKEGLTLTSQQEAELLESIAEADRGDLIPAEEVLKRLARSKRWQASRGGEPPV